MTVARPIVCVVGAWLGACVWNTGAVAPVDPTVRAKPVTAWIRGRIAVSSIAATPDDGVVIAGVGVGVGISGVVDCTSHDTPLFVVRLDETGTPRWMRCLAPPLHASVVLAASAGDSIWIVRDLDPSLPAYQHGTARDVALADRFSLDGKALGSRVIVTSREDTGMRLAAIAATPTDLVVAGGGAGGEVVGDHWEIHGTDGDGFVVAFPITGAAPRALVDEPAIDISTLAVNATDFVAAGRCAQRAAVPMVSCPGRAAVVVRGKLAGPAVEPLRYRRIDLGFESLHVALDRAGIVTIAGGAISSVAFDDTVIRRTCNDQWSFVASWSATDTLRFARSIGTCTPNELQGVTTFGLASLDGRTLVVLGAHGAETAEMPIVFGKTKLVTEQAMAIESPHAPAGSLGVIAAVDEHGNLERIRTPSRDELDTILVTAGPTRMWVALASGHTIQVIPW